MTRRPKENSGTSRGYAATSVGQKRRRGGGVVLFVLVLLVLAASLFIDGLSRGVMQGHAGPEYPAYAGRDPAPGSILVGGSHMKAAPLPPKTIVLTFEDGPSPTWTPRVLETLRHYRVPGTFFVGGSSTVAHPDLVERIHREGGEIGTNGYMNTDWSALPKPLHPLQRSLAPLAVVAATGQRTALVRPPDMSRPGQVTSAEHRRLAGMVRDGDVVVLANADTEDWRRQGVKQIVRNATPAHGRSAVVTLRDGGGDRSQTVAALHRLIPRLEARGYRFTTVSSVLGLPQTATQAPASSVETVEGKMLLVVTRIAHVVSLTGAVILAALAILTVARFVVVALLARRHSRVRRRPRPLDFRPPVSIIVPVHNEAAVIARTVRSLAASRYPYGEVIVVDDGSTDGTADVVASLRLPQVRLLRRQQAGKAAALNTGIAHASCDIIVTVDGDTVFAPHTLAELVRPLAEPDVGAVSGNAKVGNRRRLVGLWQHLEYVLVFNLERRMLDYLDAMPTVPGAVSAYRRSALADVGGLSADTIAEDTELTMALARAGWRIVYEQHASAWTQAPATVPALARQRFRWGYGTLQAMWKHRFTVYSSGRAGHLGRRGLMYLLIVQIVMPAAAPIVDVYAIYAVLFVSPALVAAFTLAFMLMSLAVGRYAFRLDGESRWALLLLPTQQLVYRHLMCFALLQTLTTALVGTPHSGRRGTGGSGNARRVRRGSRGGRVYQATESDHAFDSRAV